MHQKRGQGGVSSPKLFSAYIEPLINLLSNDYTRNVIAETISLPSQNDLTSEVVNIMDECENQLNKNINVL